MDGRLRILIVNPFGIGDVLFTTPLIRAVRRAFPDCFIGYLCNRRVEPILRGNAHLNELFVYERDNAVRHWRTSLLHGVGYIARLLRRIHRRRFDLVIDVSLGERYSFFLSLLGVRRRIGFDYRRRGRFLSARMPIEGYAERHVVSYYRSLLQFIGIHTVDDSLELRPLPDDTRWAQAWLRERKLHEAYPLVGVIPGGGVSWGISAAFRRWTVEGFASVADALCVNRDARIILFGEGRDRAVCRAVTDHMQHSVIDASGATTLGQFVALLSRMHLVICNDGGPLHLAVSQNVKTVSLFGPVDPRVYGPHVRNGAFHRVVVKEGLPCRPCYRQFRLPPCPYERACLTTIDPQEVVEACEAVLPQEAAAAVKG